MLLLLLHTSEYVVIKFIYTEACQSFPLLINFNYFRGSIKNQVFYAPFRKKGMHFPE